MSSSTFIESERLIIEAALREFRAMLAELAGRATRPPSAALPSEILVEQCEPWESPFEDRGPAVAKWRVSEQSVVPATLNEPNWSHGAKRGSFYQRGIGRFVISRDRHFLYLEYRLGPLSGRGARYAVVVCSDRVSLEETAQVWIS